MKKKFKYLLLLWVSLEIFSWIFIRLELPWIAAEKLRSHKYSALPNNCTIKASLYPHPYLGYAPNDVGTCTYSAPIPLEKDEQYFTIALTGGSAAAQLGALKGSKTHYIEEYLNEKWVHPKGKQFRIINLAVPGGAWPQSLIQLMLYGDSFDAFLDLAGYNETANLVGHSKPGKPHQLFYSLRQQIPSQSENSFGTQAFEWLLASPLTTFLPSQIALAHFILWKRIQDNNGQDPWQPRIEESFTLPQSWDEKKRLDHQMKKTIAFTTDAQHLCAQKKLLCLTVLQPIALVAKTLTDIEKIRVKNPWEYKRAERYGELIKKLKDKPNIIDATEIFKTTQDTVYGDAVHFKRDRKAIATHADKLLIDFIWTKTAHKGGWRLRK